MLLAGLGTVLIFVLQPIWGLTVYCYGIFAYPQRLTVPLGTLDFTVGRMLILILAFNTIVRAKGLRNLKWSIPDALVILFYIGKLTALQFNEPMDRWLETESGEFLDIIVPYFVARMILTSKDKFLLLIRNLAFLGVPLAVLGFYQALTGNNPVGFMTRYYAWGSTEQLMEMRMGLYRANVTFNVHILFGLFFAGMAPLTLGMWNQDIFKRNNLKVGVLFAFMILGIISSMSSGPIFSIFISLFMLMLFPFRKYWPLFLVYMILTLTMIEIYSNRHWYHVLTRLAFDAQTAYHRIGLIEEALGGGMDGHWFQGYGYVGVGTGADNTNFHWEHKDFTNMYILLLAKFGLAALAPYLCIHFFVFKRIRRAYQRAPSKEDWWTIWTIFSLMIGIDIALLTVGAFGVFNTFLYMIFGICMNLPGFFTQPEPETTGEMVEPTRQGTLPSPNGTL